MDFGLSPEHLRTGLIFFLLIFSVLVLRAYAQAWLADRLGDPTPRSDGRVTLYPPPHVDLLGTVVLPLICIFFFQPRLTQINFFLAWTKPVPVNPSYFKHPRRGEVFVQFAGFAMCVAIAFLAAVIGALLLRATGQEKLLEAIIGLISICAMLMVLDLLPVPPLPGGMLLRYWGIISEETYWMIARWAGLGLLIAFQLQPVRQFLGLFAAVMAAPFMIVLRLIAG
ncbi:MAG: site-2 protease family protein [Opitutaceae bacterium]|nr:site-2 protease family protein [Opitutaceae bacterium]